MGEVILGDFTLSRLVAPLAPQSVFLLKTYNQSVPKVSPRCQSTSESDPKLVKVMSKFVLKCTNVLPEVKRKVTPKTKNDAQGVPNSIQKCKCATTMM